MNGSAEKAGYSVDFFLIEMVGNDLWFLYVLWAFACALWPWTKAIHLAAKGPSPPIITTSAYAGVSRNTINELAQAVGGGATLILVFYLTAGLIFPVPPQNVLWLISVPLSYILNISCTVVGGMLRHTKPRASRAAFLCGAASLVLGTFLTALPPVININYPLSVTMYMVFNLYALCYVFGFYIREVRRGPGSDAIENSG